MKLLSDLLPLIAFFAAWQITDDIFVATAILMVAMTIQIAIIYMKGNTIDPVLKGSYLLVILFGALTFFSKRRIHSVETVNPLFWSCSYIAHFFDF